MLPSSDSRRIVNKGKFAKNGGFGSLTAILFLLATMASKSGEGTNPPDGEEDMFEYLYEGIGAREEDEAKERSKKEKAERKIRLVKLQIVSKVDDYSNFESPGVPRTLPESSVTTPDSLQRETHSRKISDAFSRLQGPSLTGGMT